MAWHNFWLKGLTLLHLTSSLPLSGHMVLSPPRNIFCRADRRIVEYAQTLHGFIGFVELEQDALGWLFETSADAISGRNRLLYFGAQVLMDDIWRIDIAADGAITTEDDYDI